MHILHITECFVPVKNGVSNSLSTLATAQQLSGNHVSIAAPCYPDWQEQTGHTVHRLPSFWPNPSPYPLFQPFDSFRQRAILAKIKADCIHLHHPFFAGLIALREAKHRQVPLILQAHSDYVQYCQILPPLVQKPARAFTRWWLRYLTRHCQAVIVPSETTRRAFISYGITTPIHVIPTAAISPSTLPTDQPAWITARTTLNLPQTVPVLLFVGRLAPEKNLELLLEAFLHIPEELAVHLVFIGDGPDRHRLEKIASHNPRIHFTGSLTHSETLKLFPAADLFVFPSTQDTQGLVTAEALAQGIPCVVVTNTAPAEHIQVGINGITAAPTPEAWSNALTTLLKDPVQLAHLKAGAAATGGSYSPADMAKRIETVYEQTVKDYK